MCSKEGYPKEISCRQQRRRVMGNDGDRFLYCCSLSDLIRGTSTSGEEPGCAGLGMTGR